MERRDHLSAREQLQDAVLHAPDDAPFERLRQELEGGLAGHPPHVVGSIQLPEYKAVSQVAIAHDGTIAFVGVTRDHTAELKLWHPRHGLARHVLETPVLTETIEHLHFPTGSTQPAYVATLRFPDKIERICVWGDLRYELPAPVDGFHAVMASDHMTKRFVLVNASGITSITFDGVPTKQSFENHNQMSVLLLGIANGEPVVMQTNQRGSCCQRRVRCGEWVSEWYDGVWYASVNKDGEMNLLMRRFDGEKKTQLWLVSQQGERQLELSIDHDAIFATNGRFFEVIVVGGRSCLRELTGTFDVELPTEIRVQSVVCDWDSVHVYGVFEKYGARRDEPHYTLIDLATQRVLRDHGVEDSKLVELGGRALLIGKRSFEDESATFPCSPYPHYGHPDRLVPVDGGLASWHFVDGTLYALRYELTPLA